MKNLNLLELTGLRFFAAFYVFIFHIDIRKTLPPPGIFHNIIKQGALGVNIFFILSGFILFYNYYNKKILFVDFIYKRLAKIYPAYLAGLILFALVTLLLNIKQEYFKDIFMLNIMMMQSYLPSFSQSWYGGGSWSISTEFFFYICFPLLLKLLKKLNKKQTFGLAILAYILSFVPGILFNYNLITFPLQYTFPPVRFPEFIFGCLLASLVFRHNVKISNIFIAIIIVCSALYFVFFGQRLNGYTIQNIIVLPLVMTFLISASTFKNFSLSFIGSKPLEYLGKVSYSFYIFQLPLLKFLENTTIANNLSGLKLLCIAFFINLAGAIILYHIIEIPTQKFLLKKLHNYRAKQLVV